jgi:predicted TPR repeat methyltransferase
MNDAQTNRPGMEDESERGSFAVTFPELQEDSLPQDAEYCLVEQRGVTRRIRFHDYHEIYTIPGLYEHIFYDRLNCRSPSLLGLLLEHEVTRADMDMEALRVLDVGAGNGIMGEVLADAGVQRLVGIDILEEAARAAERDRPGLYDAYHAVDLLELPRPLHQALEANRFNALTLIAALGFGDIPPEAFTVAFNFVEDGGFVAFNLRDLFLDRADCSGFERLVHFALAEGSLQELVRARYVHRLSITGEPLYYTGLIGRKLGDLPTGQPARRKDN